MVNHIDNKKKKIGNKIFKLLAGLVFLILSGVFILGITPPSIPITPSGEAQMQSVYVPMQDGTQIAVRISLPSDLEAGQKIPTVIETTRYLTDIKNTFLLNVILKLTGDTKMNMKIGHVLMEAGYAYVRVDARGSGASFGTRDMEWSKQEIEDIDEVIDWIVQQPWSNGNVGAYGISYSGNTAELAAALNHPNLKAVAPLYSDFDPMGGSVMPGGILNTFITNSWAAAVATDDANAGKSLFSGGVAPVDADKEEVMLNQALQERNNINIAEKFQAVTFYDDPLTEMYSANSLAPFHFQEDIQNSGVPFYVRVGWLDAGTADGAISRFLTFDNNQYVEIGPWNHSGSQIYDPLLGVNQSGSSLIVAQDWEVVAFFDRYLRGNEAVLPQNEIRYYTMGEGVWKTTSVWPVDELLPTTFYFHEDGSLQAGGPDEKSGSIQYEIDFTASTGERNRWFTQLGGPPVLYPDRVEEDNKLLTFTSEPLAYDVEVTGNPVVTLNLSATATDGAIYVYLETISPGGKVIYLTEGQLRVLHRKETSQDLDHVVLGPKHSFESGDAQELVPGEIVELNVGLFATSVLIPQGYRLRISIAGHDASTFKRIPEIETPVIELQTNRVNSSFVVLPMKVRQ